MEEPIHSGKVLGGRYKLGERLGAGGWGSVYTAMQTDLGRPVAIKVLHTSVALSSDGLARFEREAKAAAALGHPNIAQVTDFQANPGEPPFLVMELLTGRTLGQTMRATPKMGHARMAWIAYQILAGLDVAHRAGIVHRDIKPDNVFLVAMPGVEDFVKLLDFGIAKLSGDESAHLTTTGTMLGSPAFMAPEQVRTTHIDHRADIYAVGATLYLALAGRMPFEAETVHALLLAITEQRPLPLHVVDPSIDPALSALVERAMHKDPGGRFASAAEMRAALEPWLGGMAAHASATANAPRISAPAAGAGAIATGVMMPAPPTAPVGPPIMSQGPPLGTPPPGTPPPGTPHPGGSPPISPYGPPPNPYNAPPTPQFNAPPTPQYAPSPNPGLSNSGYSGYGAQAQSQYAAAPPAAAPPAAAPAAAKGGGAVVGLLAAVVVLLLVGVGGGGYYLYSRDSAPAPTAATAASGAPAAAAAPAAPGAATAATTVAAAPPLAGATGAAGAAGARGKPVVAGSPSPAAAGVAAPATALDAAAPAAAAAPKKQFAGTAFRIGGGQFGDFDIEASKTAIMAKGGAIGGCYAATEFDPPDHQFTDWTFQVDAAGNVKSVGRTTSFENHPKFDGCMINALRQVKWPATKAGGSPHVSFTARTRDNP